LNECSPRIGAVPLPTSFPASLDLIRDLRKKWTLTFSLLFADSFPVTPKSFPVNFDNEFRLKPAWMLRLRVMPSSI
jgi:hypothetical protein